MHPSVEHLWQLYRAINPAATTAAPEAFHFCDNQADADICAQLVVDGRKRATAPSVAELQHDGVAMPKPGDLSIVTEWSGKARALIKTTLVEICRLGDVDEEFARAEGEGDMTLAWWREAHDAYYRSVLAGRDITVDDDLEIVLEHFEAVLTI